MTLVVDFCENDAAAYAVTRWHYSRCLPTGKLVKFGVWENGTFVGAVIFSRGASPWLGEAYELDQTELCELTRVAMTSHEAPVSQAVAAAVRLLREHNPGLRLIVSFADPAEGHHGGIYQAGNWIYTGTSGETIEYFVRGKWRHVRAAYHEQKNGGGAPTRTRPGKHRYLMPLDRAMRRKVMARALPHPRSRSQGDSPDVLSGGPGSIPGDRSTVDTARLID